MRVYHFMRYKWWFLGTLTAVTVFAFITVFIVGLDLGIDFKGGVRMQVGLEKAADVDAVRAVVTNVGVKEPVVQQVSGGVSEANSYLVTAAEISDTQQDEIVSGLEESFGVVDGSTLVDSVGGSFSKDTTNRAFLAIAIAIIGIILYLSFRFEFKFAVPAIVALVHDLGLTLGIYAVTNRVVTTATVAAILTILGYSVHDTIIVFDRIRENTQLMKKEAYGDMVDLSIRQTMIRSINTTICLLLPLVAILLFGGSTLKDFAFALTIGTLTGTYSSFFVASPMVVLWKEREPRYRKRAAAAALAAAGPVPTAAADMSQASSEVQGSVKSVSPAGRVSTQAGPKVSQKPKKGKTSKRPVSKRPKR
jgi:SecD/SecF fusion protein